jgi:Mg-chelatase subunit ChlD
MKIKRRLIRQHVRWICIASLILLFSTQAITAKTSLSDPQKSSQQNDLAADLVFVLDNSGSMIKNDPQFITREIVTDYLKGLRKTFRVGMVVFDQDARLVEPLTAIPTQTEREKFLNRLDTINYKGQFTNTPVAVERAIYELKTNGREEAQKVIILLTDGIVDTGNKERDLESEKWLREDLAMEGKKAGIRIFGVAFTEKADFRLIQSLAIKTDGEYFRAYSTGDIQTVFNKIDQIIVQPVVKAEEAVPVQLPEKKPVVPEKAAPVELPDEPVKTEPVPESTAPMPLLLSGMIIIVIIFVYLVYMRRKKDVIIRADSAKSGRSGYEEDELPTEPAELIDADNIITDTSVSLSLPLDKKLVRIGRDLSNDIVIPKKSVSSFHATIEYKTGYYYLEDHRSTNGTKLNNKLIRENNAIRLKSGDTIHFADCEFRFLVPDMAPYGETVMIKRDALK